jgi:spore germination protein KC
MKKAKLLLIAALISSLLLLTGCWNYKEIESFYIVAGAAIDRSADNGYHVTFDVVDTTSGTKGPTFRSRFIESEGMTIFDAIRNAVQISDRKLYLGNIKVILISRQIASQGIAPVLDQMMRNEESRLTVGVAV